MERRIAERGPPRVDESTNARETPTNRGRRRAPARSGIRIAVVASDHPSKPDDQNMSALHEKNKIAPATAALERPHPIRNVLVVDDNVDAADTLGALLSAWGYHVTVAHDGPAALAALQDALPDIALLDIGMPAMDGYELAAHLRFQPGCAELPIVAITGSGGPEDVRRSRAKGFSAHLVKPVSAASLQTLLT
jgi:CheY-like chemotaxis protein